MFTHLREFFHGIDSLTVDKDGEKVTRDLQIAAVVLLLEVARRDGHFEQEEATAVVRAVEEEFGIDRDKALELLERAETSGRALELGRGEGIEPLKIDYFLRVINEHFDDTQKQHILAMCWKVILADGVIDNDESTFAVGLRTALGLTLEQSIRARRIAEEGRDLTLEEIPLKLKSKT
jgi:uncharacterized tellurite resistance protein B-like protein